MFDLSFLNLVQIFAPLSTFIYSVHMHFQPSEDQIMITDMARQFASSELAPHAEMWDRETVMDRAVFEKAAALGFLGI